jgi:carboxypeptidase C (cathepsin A)
MLINKLPVTAAVLASMLTHELLVTITACAVAASSPAVAADPVPSDDADVRAPIAEAARNSDHVLRLTGRTIPYKATAGTLTLRNDDGSPAASMFYVAYTVERAKGAPQRPITFFFNGGPGSASLWLNIGGFGPMRASTATPNATPPAPYVFEPNEGTLLDKSDLVFLDAIGTGYSRVLGNAQYSQFWSVDGDVDSFSRAIIRYLEINQRWNSPKFLFGESYGTTRAAAVAYKLHTQDIDFNGIILQSCLLNFGRLDPGTDEIFIDSLPTYAAAAFAHGRAMGAPADLDAFLQEVRVFARGPYAAALAKGDLVTPEEEESVARQTSHYIGVSPEYLKRSHLRVEMESFRQELLRDKGSIIGRFDARFSGPNPGTNGQYDPATNDPATGGVNGAYLAAFRHQLAVDMGFSTALSYRALYNAVIEPHWDMHHKAPGIDEPLTTPNTALDLAAVMGANPGLLVLSLNGIFDLSTPFFGTEYDLSHMLLPAEVRRNISIKYYRSGHQTYADREALGLMKKDLDQFYEAAVRKRPLH